MNSCIYCKHCCIKAGFQKSGVQKWYCKACKKYQQSIYQSKAHSPDCNKNITSLLVEGIALRGIARILGISLKSVIQKIKQIAASIRRPLSAYSRNICEADELYTYVGKKCNEVWVMYAIDRKTREVIDLKIGARTKINLQQIMQNVLARDPQTICTDGLITYKHIVPATLHKTGLPHTRHIERFNLNLRMHLKRLSRKTICFSRSMLMLEACLKIYCWRNLSS